jgi:DNA (cytosine-5)-methyltransferase 1
MKVLNLYSGIGGNRKLWTDCEVTAVEINPDIAKIYQDYFPDDKMIIADAHEYLLDHYKEYDFIWSSPPCQTHSQYRHNVGVLGKGFKPVLPDMTLYSQIVFLQTYYEGLFLIENVKPYYEPLIKPSIFLQRHLFWSNFNIKNKEFDKSKIRTTNKISDFEDYEIIVKSNIKNKRQVLRNMVNSELGLHIFNEAKGIIT